MGANVWLTRRERRVPGPKTDTKRHHSLALRKGKQVDLCVFSVALSALVCGSNVIVTRLSWKNLSWFLARLCTQDKVKRVFGVGPFWTWPEASYFDCSQGEER
jgi:hypothetical protein